jgi:hypothetical protein
MITTAAALASLTLSGLAMAQGDDIVNGFYLGAGVTQSRFDADTFTIDHKDNSWKAIAGLRISDTAAIEANYVDFGKATAPAVVAGGPFATKASAISLFAVGIMPAGWTELYVKVGAARTSADGNIGGFRFRDAPIKFAYGAGLQFRLQQLALRAEYEKYNTPVINDLDLITLGATYTFGGQ